MAVCEATTPPDGGWGWWVVAGAFVVNLLTAGSSWAYGVLYVALLDALGATKAETALVGALVYQVLVFMAPYASAACRRYGHRRVIMAGGCIASIAIIGSSFATSINQLYYTYGLLTGFGYGCCLVPSLIIIQEYFRKRMGIAIGIAMAGGGLGICIMAVLTQLLLSKYDWRGTLLILGAFNAHLYVAGALMRPVSHIGKAKRQRAKSLGYVDVRTVTHQDGKSIPMIKRLQRKYSLSVVATYTRPVEETEGNNSVNSNEVKVSNEKPVFDILEEEEEKEEEEEEDDKGSGLYDITEEDEEEVKERETDFLESPDEGAANYSKLNNEEETKEEGEEEEVEEQETDILQCREETAANYSKLNNKEETKEEGKEEEVEEQETDILQCRDETAANYSTLNNAEETKGLQSSKTNISSSKDDLSNDKGHISCCKYPRMVYDFFDSIYNFSLFKDPVYVFFQVGVLLGFMGMGIVTVHVVKRAKEFGILGEYAASLVYGFGIAQALGRTLGGVAVDHIPLNKIVMSASIMILCGVAVDVSIYVTSYIGQLVSIFIVGFLFGLVATISMGVLADTFGAKLLSYTISVCYFVGGVGIIVGPTLAGLLRDTYGVYTYSFHLAALAEVLCGILLLLMIPFLRWHRQLEKEQLGSDEQPAADDDGIKEDEPVAAEDVV